MYLKFEITAGSASEQDDILVMESFVNRVEADSSEFSGEVAKFQRKPCQERASGCR